MFVGKSRFELLSTVLTEWHYVHTRTQPRLVVLVGEPGFGKTKLVHEFYRRVMSTQDQPAYWPSEIVEDEGTLTRRLGMQRKAVRPVGFTPPPGAEPGILWLGADIKGSAGLSVDQAIDDLVGQLSLHLARVLQRRERNQHVVSLATKMISILGLVPDFLELGVDTVEVVKEIRKAFEKDSTGRTISHNAGYEERLAALYRTIRQLWGSDGLGGPPIIIVIEDLHSAQEPTIALIEQLLLAERLPVLIIATSQAQALAGASVPRGLIYGGIPGKTIIEVDRLASDDIDEMIEAYLPNTAPHLRDALALRASGNPYQLQLFLVSQAHNIHQGRLDIELEDIDDLPMDLDGILTRLWSDLDTPDQILLSALALTGPQAPTVVDNALRDELRMPDLTSLTSTGWVRVEPLSRIFLELARWHVASTRSPLSRRERRSLISRAMAEVVSLLLDETGELDRSMLPLLRTCLAELVETALEDSVRFDESVVAAELRSWSTELRYSGQVQQSLRIAELGLASVGELEALSDPTVIDTALHLLRIRSVSTSLLRGAGDPEGVRAAERYRSWSERFSSSHPDHVVRSWTRLSRACRTPRRDDALLARSRDALDQARRALEQGTWPDRRLERDVRAAAYPHLSRAGRRREAAVEAQKVCDLTISLFGAAHPLSISGLTDVAFYTRRFDTRRGAELYRDVLAARLAQWGDASHVGTTASAVNLSVALAELGDAVSAQEAMALADHAHSIRLRAWGDTRSGTFVALGARANARIEYSFHVESEEAEGLRVEGMEMALEAAEGLKRLRTQTQTWRQREYIAVARSALGDRSGLDDLKELAHEREAGIAEPWTRGDLRRLAEKRVRALRGFGREDAAKELARDYRLHLPEADVLK